MKQVGLTELLFFAAFILTALISMKVIENRDKEIIDLKTMHVKDSTINQVNISNHIKDSIRNEFCPEVKVEKDNEGNYTFYYN
jgi:hypothetical protein